MTSEVAVIVPVILSGGSGTRLWPMSRPEKPKQLLSLTAEQTMLQLTALRVPQGAGFADPIIVANAQHTDMIEAQLQQVGVKNATLILEPLARNTAPAIALAALVAVDPASVLLVMPSDHVIADVQGFHDALGLAVPLAQQGWLITFGIEPDAPETGYGYIKMASDELGPGVRKVDRFVEKPDAEKAAAMLAEGNHAWNAGIFLFRADAYLAAMAAFAPDMLDAASKALALGERRNGHILPDAASFAGCASDSIDYAIMERADQVACVPTDIGWSDVGSWDSLYAISERDDKGNSIRGAVTAVNVNNCFVRSDGAQVALVGVENLIVVVDGDKILILPCGQSQDVKKATEMMKAQS